VIAIYWAKILRVKLIKALVVLLPSWFGCWCWRTDATEWLWHSQNILFRRPVSGSRFKICNWVPEHVRDQLFGRPSCRHSAAVCQRLVLEHCGVLIRRNEVSVGASKTISHKESKVCLNLRVPLQSL
jgi:hypothetical protein